MLRWIQFRAVGWQFQESNILRHDEGLGPVPTGLIYQHDDEVVFEIFCHMLQEDVHHVCVRIGENQRGHLSKRHTNGAVHVYKRPDDLPWHNGPNALGCPTGRIAVVDSSESPFILCHESNGTTIIRISFSDNLVYLFRKFFLKSSWALASPFG